MVIIAGLSIGSYRYYQTSQAAKQILIENVAKLNVVVEEQKATIIAIQQRYKQQVTAAINLVEANSTLNSEKLALSDKLMKHDLEELSRRKPGLIETRINNGTQDLFDSIIAITAQ